MDVARLKEAICMMQLIGVVCLVAGFCIGSATTYTAGFSIGMILFFCLAPLGGWAILKGVI